MSERLSIDCGTFPCEGEGETQLTQDVTRPKKTRIRKRSLTIQLQEALNSAQLLETSETNELSIARMKLIQTRLDCLLKMQARERNDKLKQALAEVERLKAENEQLKAAALAKPRPLTAEEIAVQKFYAEKERMGGTN